MNVMDYCTGRNNESEDKQGKKLYEVTSNEAEPGKQYTQGL